MSASIYTFSSMQSTDKAVHSVEVSVETESLEEIVESIRSFLLASQFHPDNVNDVFADTSIYSDEDGEDDESDDWKKEDGDDASTV